jgi:hypothetical protein
MIEMATITEQELDAKMNEVRKLQGLLLSKLRKIETNRDLQKENSFLLKSVHEEFTTNQQLRTLMATFFYTPDTFFCAS